MPSKLPGSLRQMPAVLRNLSAAVAVLAAASVSLAYVAWTQPVTSAVSASDGTSSSATFAYQATVPPSAAYDDTTVTNPQPVFRNLADEVDVTLTYDGPPAGRIDVTVELGTANGWQSTVPLPATTTFSGSRHRSQVRLDLHQLQRRADAAAVAIGGEPAGDISVTVVAEVDGGAGDRFRPELAFTLTSTALRLTAGEDAPLTIERPGSGPSVTANQAATIPLLGKSMTVHEARRLATAGLTVAIAAAVVVALLRRRARSVSEAEAIQTRYAQMLLPVEPIALPAGRPVVDLPHIGALVRLAERYGLLVLHWRRGDTLTYVVMDDGTTYRYRTGATSRPGGCPDQETISVSPAEGVDRREEVDEIVNR